MIDNEIWDAEIKSATERSSWWTVNFWLKDPSIKGVVLRGNEIAFVFKKNKLVNENM